MAHRVSEIHIGPPKIPDLHFLRSDTYQHTQTHTILFLNHPSPYTQVSFVATLGKKERNLSCQEGMISYVNLKEFYFFVFLSSFS